MQLFCGVMMLTCSGVAALPGNNAPYPKEKVAEFVVENLDITTLPPAIRPKREKGKKTFGDYGYAARQVDETEALLEAAPGAQVSIRILEQEASGIYVCAGNTGKDESNGHIERVLLLKLKESNGLLKSRESSKEFNSCPVIGGTDDSDAAAASSY
jgi:hypothetical protein